MSEERTVVASACEVVEEVLEEVKGEDGGDVLVNKLF